MKNFQLTSRETDSKILVALALLGFAIAGFLAGGFVPMPINQVNRMPWVLAAISVGLALFTWSVFRIIRPAYPDRNWQIAEAILIPVFWLLLLVAADLSLSLLVQHSMQELQDIFNTLA